MKGQGMSGCFDKQAAVCMLNSIRHVLCDGHPASRLGVQYTFTAMMQACRILLLCNYGDAAT